MFYQLIPDELARVSGISQSTMSKILARRQKSMNFETVRRLIPFVERAYSVAEVHSALQAGDVISARGCHV